MKLDFALGTVGGSRPTRNSSAVPGREQANRARLLAAHRALCTWHYFLPSKRWWSEELMKEPMVILCPACGAKLRLPAETHGRTVRCAKCKEPFQAPAGPAERPKEVSAYDWAPDSQTAPPPVSTDDTAAPPRRKKKRKAVNREIADNQTNRRGVPAWAVWWGSLVVVSGLVAAAFVAMYMNGYRFLTL